MALIKRFPLVLAASLASTIGGLPFNTLPVVLGALGASLGLSATTLGDLAGTLFAGYFAGTLLALTMIDRLDWRWVTVAAAVGTSVAYAVSAQSGATALPAVLAVMGLFSALMTALGLRVLAQLPDKEQAFGFRQSTELWITAAVLFVLPPFVIAPYGYRGLALALGALVLLLGLSARWLPRGPDQVAALGLRWLPAWRDAATAWVVLGFFFFYLAGNIGLWAFLGHYAVAAQLTPAESGLAFAVLKVLGGVAAVAVAVFGGALGILRGQWVALAGVTAGLLWLHFGQGLIGFAGGAWTWEFFFTVGCILQTATIASFDGSQRWVVLVPAAFAASSMIAPPIAGRLLEQVGPSALLWAAFAAAAVPALFYPRLLGPALQRRAMLTAGAPL